MDEVVHLKLSKEEYLISAPRNVPKNIAFVEKLYKKQSINTMRKRFFVEISNMLQILFLCKLISMRFFFKALQ